MRDTDLGVACVEEDGMLLLSSMDIDKKRQAIFCKKGIGWVGPMPRAKGFVPQLILRDRAIEITM